MIRNFAKTKNINVTRSLSSNISPSVHGNRKGKGPAGLATRKPLLRRAGDQYFKSGDEASSLLISEAIRKGEGSSFMDTWSMMNENLAVVYQRFPRYAWLMKDLIEPEMNLSFRVAWVDDLGVKRVNRGFRVQYSSTLGPFEGGTAFAASLDADKVKAGAFDNTFRNALATGTLGGAYGGADLNPHDKSDSELQRICQSYMTGLSKFIGKDLDYPGIGEGVTEQEIGWMYGQWKRLKDTREQPNAGVLWGGSCRFKDAQGISAVMFAEKILTGMGKSLEGKKCLITGSHYVALAVAEKLLEIGAIPLCFSDMSTHVYEPEGFTASKLKNISRIKEERGAGLGRYIVSSTTAKINEPVSIFDIPCDVVFACSSGKINGEVIKGLSAQGCKMIVEGVPQAISPDGVREAKRVGMVHAPYLAAMAGATLQSGAIIQTDTVKEDVDKLLQDNVDKVLDKIQRTATEFNVRGDLLAGAQIAAFLKVANMMINHGSV